MADWLQPEVTTLAFCWRLARRDGITFGFTSHDAELFVGDLLYRATPGMVPSSIERSSGFDVDSVELSGVLTSDAVREDDLKSGRWDGARLTLFAANWEAPEIDPVHLLSGELGAVDMSGDKFSAELRGPTAILDAPFGVQTSPTCRATLGDKQCRVDLAARTHRARIISCNGATLTLDQTIAGDVLARGRLRWLDGPNAGLFALIIAHSGTTITLVEAPFAVPSAGTRADLIEGCDRRFQTCIARFANAANFQGEPHLPGNDLLMRYAS